jgi:hypothetical protein
MVDDSNSRDSVNCLESLLGWLVATAAQPGWGRMANAKSIGWSIYAAGFVIWLFGYLSAGARCCPSRNRRFMAFH